VRNWREAKALQEIPPNPWIHIVSRVEKCDAAALEEFSWLCEYCSIALFGESTC